jgi:hypothetical protein
MSWRSSIADLKLHDQSLIVVFAVRIAGLPAGVHHVLKVGQYFAQFVETSLGDRSIVEPKPLEILESPEEGPRA